MPLDERERDPYKNFQSWCLECASKGAENENGWFGSKLNVVRKRGAKGGLLRGYLPHRRLLGFIGLTRTFPFFRHSLLLFCRICHARRVCCGRVSN